MESKEDLDNLLEESSMPLQTLLSRYGGTPALENRRGSEKLFDLGSGKNRFDHALFVEEERETLKRQGISSILKVRVHSV